MVEIPLIAPIVHLPIITIPNEPSFNVTTIDIPEDPDRRLIRHDEIVIACSELRRAAQSRLHKKRAATQFLTGVLRQMRTDATQYPY